MASLVGSNQDRTYVYHAPDPKEHDIAEAVFKGGHPQPRILVAAAMATRRISVNQVEVLLDTPVMLSYGSGPRCRLDRYILHTDGCVRYWESQLKHGADNKEKEDVVCEWDRRTPRWEFTSFPVLPSVVEGI